MRGKGKLFCLVLAQFPEGGHALRMALVIETSVTTILYKLPAANAAVAMAELCRMNAVLEQYLKLRCSKPQPAGKKKSTNLARTSRGTRASRRITASRRRARTGASLW
jgi:hypothetical protein